ncbi:hypothetical protein LTR78_010022 [Recurvomyces mirabilis]|uniref:DM2 domain-containing protein n=1 Tax=Recurvomyces mirabilis TaxID=574656 RepID=A0AAE0TN06_9PEZI|nr:hypothetical protein LTR78_010022 [Recurvomyces mirabilis]KAK5149803.1 hypothetical protein LTS14_010624 [Recurvomyces mirabilis]
MSSDLPTEQMASYSAIIDDILASADLDVISAKALRKGLQAKVDYDLSEQKEAITALIMQRFDKAQQQREATTTTEPAPTTNGTHGTTHHESASPPPSHKRKADTDDDDEDSFSDVKDSPPPPKKMKKAPKSEAESDEQIARRLQAEFSAGGGRSTRGGGAATTTKKKKSITKKDKKPKRKSATKIHSDDDSDVASTSPKPEKEKKGGFHKLMNLSEPLTDLLGESQLSRPQTVKRIWAYVKERDLQDPSDKRQIRCDEKMRAVFKTEKVHMFTMNKVLATQLWPAEEVV